MPKQVPIFDGSAKEWVKAIEQVGLKVAKDQSGNNCEKMAPYVNEPMHVWRGDSFVAAFPSQKFHITYGIDFPQVCFWLDYQFLFSRVQNLKIEKLTAASVLLSFFFSIYESYYSFSSLYLLPLFDSDHKLNKWDGYY